MASYKAQEFWFNNDRVVVRHDFSDGEVNVFFNGTGLVGYSNEEHENAVVTYENTCELLDALSRKLDK